MTQQELAERLGVSDKTISRWENGNNLPDASLYNLLCEELDITINELLSGQKLEEKEYQKKLEENIILLNENTKRKFNNKIKKIIFFTIIIILAIIIVGFICLSIIDYYDNKKTYFKVTDVHYEVCKFKPNTNEEQIIIKSTTNNGENSIAKVKSSNNGDIVIHNFKYDKWEKHPELALSHTRIGTSTIEKINRIYYDETLIWDGKEELNECIESRGITRTYNVVGMEKSNDDNYLYLTLRQFQDEDIYTALISKEFVNDVKIGKNYEFTFDYSMTTFLKDKTTRGIFEELELLSIKETDKVGLNQINDEIY